MPLKAERDRFLDDRDFPATVTITASRARKIRVENLRSRVKTLDRFRRGPDTAVDKVSAERLDHGPARGTLPHMTPTICILAMCLSVTPADRQAQPPESGAQAARPSEVIETRPRQEQPERDVAGVQSTPAVAPDELERRAERGEPEAQNELGVIYADRARRDEAKAVEWYRNAAEQGLAEAQYNLGVMYRDGRGVAGDPITGYAWLSIAAKAGFVPASDALSKLRRAMSRSDIAVAERRAVELQPKPAVAK
jgi:TPR repeat protein